MNLWLVVLSENNEVFFQASLVTSELLSTTFTLPDVGAYTIGVFRISLVEPDDVEPTVFQLRGSRTTNGEQDKFAPSFIRCHTPPPTSLKQEIPLRQRQDRGRLAGQQLPIGAYFVRLRVNIDLRHGVVVDHVGLANRAALRHRHHPFLQP